jgi:hypothetical protein
MKELRRRYSSVECSMRDFLRKTSNGMIKNGILALVVYFAFYASSLAAAPEAPIAPLATRAGVAEPPGSQASEQPPADASLQAACRELEVEIDEGYGVSSRERRFVCGDSR